MQRKPLKHRDYVVDLESRLGKTQVSSSFFFFLVHFFMFVSFFFKGWF